MGRFGKKEDDGVFEGGLIPRCTLCKCLVVANQSVLHKVRLGYGNRCFVKVMLLKNICSLKYLNVNFIEVCLVFENELALLILPITGG